MDSAALASLARGLAWLSEQQAEDGGWHSAAYGQLKDGASVTALALEAVSHTPPELHKKHTRLAERGYAFLEPGLAKKQTIASPDGSLDYPTYAAALWLLGRRRLGIETTRESQAAVVKYLLTAQVAEGRGFMPESASYGGWDFLGPDDARGITTGTNISVTAYVLEALAESWADRDAARERALAWVQRCQQPDGGFAFTPEPMSLGNKADFQDAERRQARSYGTATCDGLRALIALERKADDPAVRRALAWLVARPGLELVPGFEQLPLEVGWQRGLRYYYYAALGRCLAHFPISDRDVRARALAELLVKQQRSNGRWENESSRMREDDPLIATSLAIVALAEVLRLEA